MLGFPHGWVDIDGVSRTAQLRALGNSVQVQVGTVAGAFLLTLTNDAPRDTVRQSPKEQ